MGLFEQVVGQRGGALSGTGGQQSALVGGLLEMLGNGQPLGLEGV